MGYVPYVGFATYHRATMKIPLYFKRLMFMQMKKKKKGVVTYVISLYHVHVKAPEKPAQVSMYKQLERGARPA